MVKQKLDEIFGDLCYDVHTTAKWEKVEKDIDSLICYQKGLKYLALNKTFVIPAPCKETQHQNFPAPVTIPASEEESPVRVLNRLTLDLKNYGDNLDTLMHTLTRNFLPEKFDLIAVRPYSFAQLDAFLNTHNITVDIICMDKTVTMLDHLRVDVFKRMKAQKFYMEQLYSPILLSKDPEVRLKLLRAPNHIVPHSIRYCKKFLLSSGAYDVSDVKTFHDLEGIALAMGFAPKLYRKVVQENVFDCILESDSKRYAFKNTTVFQLSDKLLHNWTYNHETRRRIEKFRKESSEIFTSAENIFCPPIKIDSNETCRKDSSQPEAIGTYSEKKNDDLKIFENFKGENDAFKTKRKRKKERQAQFYDDDTEQMTIYDSKLKNKTQIELVNVNTDGSTSVEIVPKNKRIAIGADRMT